MKRYIMYRCKICNKITILVKDEVDHSEQAGIYQTCGHDGRHRDLVVAGAYDNLEECMEGQKIYEKRNGRIRQLN